MGEPGPFCAAARGGERRQSKRFAAAMPLTVDGLEGITQDLSTTGLSFRCMRPYEPGTQVEAVIEYLLDGHHHPLRCLAVVVSSQAEGDGWRIGAQLAPQSRIAPVSPGEEPAPGRPHLRSVA